MDVDKEVLERKMVELFHAEGLVVSPFGLDTSQVNACYKWVRVVVGKLVI